MMIITWIYIYEMLNVNSYNKDKRPSSNICTLVLSKDIKCVDFVAIPHWQNTDSTENGNGCKFHNNIKQNLS